MREEKEIEQIIRSAPLRMQQMLLSVYCYNRNFKTESLKKILSAMALVDRKFFTDSEAAYYDNALPIGEGQTISQPSTVARMLLIAELKAGEDVLEIGAGSGWNACLIAFLVYPGRVASVDRIQILAEKAKENVSEVRNHLKQTSQQDAIKLGKIDFFAEDIFSKGRVWKKKYDKVIITAGIANAATEKKIEEMAQNLLKQDGILICPYVSGPMIIYRKNKKLEKEETKEEYVFVPLLEGAKI